MALPPKPLQDMMADCSVATKKEFEFENQMLRVMGGTFIETFDLIFKESLKHNNEIAVLGISIRTFRYLQAAINAICDGYYEVAMSLLRNVYENNLLAYYLARHEDNAKQWLLGKKYIEQWFLRREIGHAKIPFYKALSTFYAHNERSESLTPVMHKDKMGKLTFDIYPEFNKEKCKECMYGFIMLEWQAIMELHHAFKERLSKDAQWSANYLGWNKVMLEYLQEKIIKKSGVKFSFREKLPERF
jgi:hypothetical protein